MKRWQLLEARKYLIEIIDDVLEGEVQAIVKPSGEMVYLIPGQKRINYHPQIPTKELSPIMLN